MKRHANFLGSALFFALLLLSAPAVHAQEATSTPEAATSTAHLIIEGGVDVPATCEVTDTDGVIHAYPESASSTYLAVCAVAAALHDGVISSVGLSNEFPTFGLFVTSVNDVVAASSSQFWALYQNNDLASVGLTSLPVAEGDTVELQLQDFSGTDLGDRLTLHINTLIGTSTDESGGDTAAGTESVTIALRDGDTLVGPFTVELPSTSTPPVSLTPTSGGSSHDVSARSVLALLAALDATTTDFALTDLAYFDAFDAFIINCIELPAATSTPECFNWTYAVDGTFPFVGMDKYALEDGDTASVIFGSQWRVSATSTIAAGEPFTVTAEEYNPASGSYEPAVGVGVGAVQFDDSFTATEFATSTTNAEGQAQLSLPFAGTYSIGITSTGYFPNVSVAVTEAPPPSDEGGGGGSSSHEEEVDVDAALAYLLSEQESDGFGSLFLSDWAAIALAAAGANTSSLRAYFTSRPFELDSVTDYERHAMALLALDIDPYDAAGADYIEPIARAFDGAQIGDDGLDNDDIFALFPLLHAGYGTDDAIIEKTVAFIVSRQQGNGSWDGSVDVTAAAIQALSLVGSLPGVSDALSSAQTYVRGEQNGDGGFGNSFSTSWVLQAIDALGDSPSAWSSGGKTPEDYLAQLQEEDGGIEPASSSEQTRIWATAYAIPAALGATWDSLLESFDAPVADEASGGSRSSPADDTATSTLPAATTSFTASTTTAVAASTTPEVLGAFTANTTLSAPSALQPATVKEDGEETLPADAPAAVASAPAPGLLLQAWSAVVSFVSLLIGFIRTVVH